MFSMSTMSSAGPNVVPLFLELSFKHFLKNIFIDEYSG